MIEPGTQVVRGQDDDAANCSPWGLRDLLRASLAAIGLLGLGLVLFLLPLALFSDLTTDGLTTRLQVLAVLALEALLIVPAWRWGPGKYGGGWASLGLRPVSPAKTVVMVSLGFLVVLVINAFSEAVRNWLGLPGQPEFLPLFGRGLGGLALALFLGGVIAPLAEEIFFRGFLHAGLRSRWGVPLGALLSSLIFGLVHFAPGVFLGIFLMGLVLAYLYERSGSLWPCILLHGAINSLGFIVSYLMTNHPGLMPVG